MSGAIITAALTGPIATKADNPALPTSPEEIAEAARGASAAGASIVHVHLRDADGNPTADLEVAHRVVGLINERCDALVQLSTGVGLTVPLWPAFAHASFTAARFAFGFSPKNFVRNPVLLAFLSVDATMSLSPGCVKCQERPQCNTRKDNRYNR